MRVGRVMGMSFDYELMFGVDKQMHFFSYAIMSILLGIVVVLVSDDDHVKQNMSLIWITLVLIGIAEEYRQYMLPNRSAEFLDAIANMVGVTLGLFIPFLISTSNRYRGHFLFKRFAFYSIVIIPLILGLLYLNERPFIILEKPFLGKLGEPFWSFWNK